jgi:NADH:ubiquinone oxidoreductase subunit D
LAGRVCGICNVVHTTCYSEGVEKVGNIEVPPRAKYLRTLLNELERVHSHMLALAVLGELVGFHTLFMLIMRDREPVLALKEMVAFRIIDYFKSVWYYSDLESLCKVEFTIHMIRHHLWKFKIDYFVPLER